MTKEGAKLKLLSQNLNYFISLSEYISLKDVIFIIEEYLLSWDAYITTIIVSACDGNFTAIKWYLSNPRLKRYRERVELLIDLDDIISQCLVFYDHLGDRQGLILKKSKTSYDMTIPKNYNEIIHWLNLNGRSTNRKGNYSHRDKLMPEPKQSKMLLELLYHLPALEEKFKNYIYSVEGVDMNNEYERPYELKAWIESPFIDSERYLEMIESRGIFTQHMYRYLCSEDEDSGWCKNLDSDEVCENQYVCVHTKKCIEYHKNKPNKTEEFPKAETEITGIVHSAENKLTIELYNNLKSRGLYSSLYILDPGNITDQIYQNLIVIQDDKSNICPLLYYIGNNNYRRISENEMNDLINLSLKKISCYSEILANLPI